MNDRLKLSVGVLLTCFAMMGCQSNSLPVAPGAAANDPSNSTPIAIDVGTTWVAAAKLIPASGGTVTGEMEFYDRGDAVVVSGIAVGMNPSFSYSSLLHDSTSGCSVISPDAVKLAEWIVSKKGVGHLKAVVPTLTAASLRNYGTVSVLQNGRSTSPVQEVAACGRIQFP